MNSRKLNIRTENWSEEPFSISRSYEEDNFDVVVVELEQGGIKSWGEGSPTKHYNESIQQTEALLEESPTSQEILRSPFPGPFI